MQSWLTAEISVAAVEHNLSVLRALLPTTTKLCAVVKADCYGHGLFGLLDVISQNADWLAVATPEEALDLRALGYAGPLLSFFPPTNAGAGSREGFAELIASDVTLTLVSPAEVADAAAAAKGLDRTAEVHLCVDTGMHRRGAALEAVAELAAQVRAQDALHLGGLYTHFASADEADKTSARDQLARFSEAASAYGSDGMLLHAANSAATIDLPEAHLGMVRPGIALYGYHPSDEMHNRPALRPVLRLVSRLMQIRDIPPGERCGYGLTHTFRRSSRVGLVPVGYADGYLRALSNRACMRVDGEESPVCGRVSMDQTIIDLTDIPGARVGDEVEVYSRDPDAPNSVENLSRIAGVIPYELTSRLGRRARREVV
jgi:alanine racemase